MESTRGHGTLLRRFAWIGCLAAAAAVTACASAPSSSVSGATPAVTAAGAPVPASSAVVAGSALAQREPGKAKPRAAASRASATAPASSGPAAGNPGGHATVPAAGQAVGTSHPDHVIGSGTPASCTPAAVVAAVAAGGVITFSCGQNPVTITMTAAA